MVKAVLSNLGSCCLWLFFLSLTQGVLAHDYRARADVADWHLQLSPMECRMWQEIPVYGEAVFSYKAGDEQRFYLQTEKSFTRVGKVTVSAVPPAWRHQQPAHFIASTQNALGRVPIRVGEQMANRLLAELEEGMFPSFTHVAWSPDHELTVYVSAVNFAAAYRDYIHCVADLSPTSYDDISTSMSFDEVTRSIPATLGSQHAGNEGEGDGLSSEGGQMAASKPLGQGANDKVRSIFLFATDHWRVTPAMRQHLARIAQAIRQDKTVRKVRVDGHTDDVASNAYNWALSRRRGESIKQALIDDGVDPELILMKYHGEEEPRVPNSNAKNRAKNRRVLVVIDHE